MNGPHIPRAAIIIPVYNAGKFLSCALDSALGQTLREIEVIAVDDGSTDDSFRILTERAASDGRLKVLRQPANSGTFSARNRGLRECRSEYVMFLDPDDFLEKTAAEQLSALADREKADIVQFGTREFTRSENGVMKPLYDWTPRRKNGSAGPAPWCGTCCSEGITGRCASN